MVAFYFDFPRPADHFIQITLEIDVSGRDQVVLKIPTWRPGRYQSDRFAKNIRDWQPADENDQALQYSKPDPDTWVVETGRASKLFVKYKYYAYKLDAGNSMLDDNLIYINPLNCCLYDPGFMNHQIDLYMNIPAHFKCATALPSGGSNQFSAQGFDQLFENPVIAAPDLQHDQYRVHNKTFHVWFQGTVNPDWQKIQNDFTAFTEEQINMFGSLPVNDYHFFVLAPPYPLYHGVEHFTNTVITLGPGYKLMNHEDYQRLLGISSHELFHVWNVKTIRPAEWMPYDYSKESPSVLGYIAEGVTVYYGDKMLLNSGVWNFDEYKERLDRVLTRHFNNYGRFFKSLSESSYETWLDGYEPGIPHRKVSIYIKGGVCALILDLLLRKDTNGRASLDDVMIELYNNYGKKQRGITQQDYKKIIEKIAGRSYDDYFNQYIDGTVPLEDPLNHALELIGCKMVKKERETFHESRLGMIMNGNKINNIAPGSPAEESELSPGDEIISVDGIKVGQDGKNLNDILLYLKDLQRYPLKFLISRNHEIKTKESTPSNNIFYADYQIEKKTTARSEQKEQFRLWAKASF